MINKYSNKHNQVRIPTGWRLTSWLFKKRGGVESGTTKHKSFKWQGEAGFSLVFNTTGRGPVQTG